MSQSDSRGLVLGVLAGAAGLTLAVVWYQNRRSSAGGRMVTQELYLNSNDRHVGAGMSVALAGQREVLDRLGALIQCVSELKDEVRALKTALPLLQDHVRDELQGGSRSRRATPTRRRRIAEAVRHEGQSSEEAESEGGYMTAMTDSEEDSEKEREAEEKEEDEGEEENQEEPDELTALLERADALHAVETERGGGLAPLLERRDQEESDSELSEEQSRGEAVDQQQMADQQQIADQQQAVDQQQIVDHQQIADQQQAVDQQQIVDHQQIADQQQIVDHQQTVDQQQIVDQQKTVDQHQREEGSVYSEAEMEECQVTPVQRRGEEFKGDESNGELSRAEVGQDLRALLDRADSLHAVEEDRTAALAILLRRRPEFEQNYAFMWRLARAYSDAHDKVQDREEKKEMAESGKKAGEEAITLNPNCAESHQWFAILCGQLSEYDTIQNKIKNGYLFKDHLDLAIELKPADPLSYYLLGRWCYAVAQCTWIERKIAATLFGEPPNATVQDALQNFLKAEEICPQYSKSNLVFLAKCYKDLGQKQQAREVCNTASCIDNTTTEDNEAQKELDSLLSYL